MLAYSHVCQQFTWSLHFADYGTSGIDKYSTVTECPLHSTLVEGSNQLGPVYLAKPLGKEQRCDV